MKKSAPHYTGTALLLGGILGLSACGGGGDSGTTVAATSSVQTGVFLDSAVEGIEYSSGSTSGITDALGTYKYEVGKPVTFKLGSVVLGTLNQGKAKAYPIDLVNGATDETNSTVSNIVRVLQTLDDDGNPANGIKISSNIRNTLKTPFNFGQAKTAFGNDATVAAAIAAATAFRSAGASALKDALSAEEHMRSTLLVDFAGTWTGNYSSTTLPSESGTCSVNFGAAGIGTGTCRSSTFNTTFNVAGAISSNGTGTISGATGTGAVFTGTFQRTGSAAGAWTATSAAGTWTATKN